MKNVALILNNLNELKILLPLSEILKKKNKVYFFIESDKSKKNKKSYLIPTNPLVKKYVKSKQYFFFSRLGQFSDLVNKYKIKKILSTNPPSYYSCNKNWLEERRLTWIGLSWSHNIFPTYSLYELNEFNKILTVTKKKDKLSIDYLKKRKDHFLRKKENYLSKKIKYELINNIKKKLYPVGTLAFHNCKIQDKKKQLCKKYNLSKNKNYLLLFWHDVWAYRNNLNQFLMNKNFLQQFLDLFIAPSKKKFALFFKGYRFSKLFRSIQKYAVNNNFNIIIKSRKKSYIPNYLKRDNKVKIFYDNDYYPSTTTELISISDLCIITYLSYSINDVSFLKKPIILTIPDHEFSKMKDMQIYDTILLNNVMYDESYYSKKNKIFKIHPIDFINLFNKKKMNYTNLFNGRIFNDKFIKKNIYDKYSKDKPLVSVDEKQILKI